MISKRLIGRGNKKMPRKPETGHFKVAIEEWRTNQLL